MFRTIPTYRRDLLGVLAIVLWMCALSAIAQAGETPFQSPRQALIEMFSGNADKFRQHLTQDVQDNGSPVGPSNALKAFASAIGTAGKLESFDSGPILFSFNDAQQHQRREIHLDADDLVGDEDRMELSLHSFHEGIEEVTPSHLRLHLDLILQQSVWRLNTITMTLELPVGDPRTFDASAWWAPQLLLGLTTADRTSPPDNEAAGQGTATERPRISAMRAVRLVTLAENLYAQKHPQIGYTCAIENLVSVGKGLDETGPYDFLDPAFAGGLYNGYTFAIKGCEGRPAKSFQVFAEPVSGTGKAYCSDDRHNLRSSDDGRGATCLAAGKIARQ